MQIKYSPRSCWQGRRQRLWQGLALLMTSAALISTPYAQSSSNIPTPSKRPNIVVLLADDLGFSDIASYGSEINTPSLDALANEGIRFSNYHTSASCAPTRAMLLTGVDSHLAGVANIAEAMLPSQEASPNYQGVLTDKVVTVATLLKESGYHTYMAGKWHLGYKDPAKRPINRGFEQTVMMPFSGADNWSNKSYLPNYAKALWFENGEPTELPEDFFSSDFLVDKAIEHIASNHGDNKPFFTYIGFQAVHIPVQAPREYTEKYLDTYKSGWGELRVKRQQRVRELGLIRADAPIKRMDTTEDWSALSDDEKRYNAKRMAVYAGMVDNMDFHIGRLVDYLKEIGEYDNTIFIFTSDNGPEPSDPKAINRAFPIFLKLAGYNDDYETLGEKNSYNTIGTSFASAAASPLGHYKFHAGEGGLRVPMIIAGPMLDEDQKGRINHALSFVKDLAATILAYAGVEHPDGRYKGKEVYPITGKSLAPLIAGLKDEVHSADDVIAYEIGGNAALIKGNYKIVYNRGDEGANGAGDSRWHLYNIEIDPGETKTLESTEPKVFADLLSEYERYVIENGVLPIPENYEQRKQVMLNALQDRVLQPIKAALLSPLAMLIMAALAAVFTWRRLKSV